MTDALRPDDAAQALAEIDQRREQVIELTIIPWWYWWAIAGLQVGLVVAVDTRLPLAIGLGTVGFVIGVLTATGWVMAGALRRAQPRGNMLSPVGVLAILGFVAVVLAVALPTAFVLDANGIAHPAIWGVLLGGVVMVVGGPMLSRLLRRIMVAKRLGGLR
ncbi:hypothetical protein ACIA8G_21280 [Lentzea sp. NPDC051213]|uniref:hypothetical protein n=1 Tax=Lentzea sp. NPDC051213 TaxID=3364126 RepID=UPI0037AC135B